MAMFSNLKFLLVNIQHLNLGQVEKLILQIDDLRFSKITLSNQKLRNKNGNSVSTLIFTELLSIALGHIARNG